MIGKQPGLDETCLQNSGPGRITRDSDLIEGKIKRKEVLTLFCQTRRVKDMFTRTNKITRGGK